MEHVLRTLQPYISHYGYLAIVTAVFLEDFGVPVPGETLLIAGALLATQGRLNIFILMAAAWVGAVLGDNVGYLIGRAGGRRLVLRFGRYVLITPHRLAYAERFFRHHGGIIVVVARFIEVLRQLNGIIAGIVGMVWGRFLLFNGLGAALWVAAWSMLFYELGNQGERISALFTRYEPVALVVVLILIGGAFALHVIRSRPKY